MRANHRRDTGPEWAVRRLLHARGLRYRVDWPLPTNRRWRADIAFTRQRVAVFVDGCFWHGCPTHYQAPKTNAEFWANKVDSNRARDLAVSAGLEMAGWTVLRAWEHETPDRLVSRIVKALALSQ